MRRRARQCSVAGAQCLVSGGECRLQGGSAVCREESAVCTEASVVSWAHRAPLGSVSAIDLGVSSCSAPQQGPLSAGSGLYTTGSGQNRREGSGARAGRTSVARRLAIIASDAADARDDRASHPRDSASFARDSASYAGDRVGLPVHSGAIDLDDGMLIGCPPGSSRDSAGGSGVVGAIRPSVVPRRRTVSLIARAIRSHGMIVAASRGEMVATQSAVVFEGRTDPSVDRTVRTTRATVRCSRSMFECVVGRCNVCVARIDRAGRRLSIQAGDANESKSNCNCKGKAIERIERIGTDFVCCWIRSDPFDPLRSVSCCRCRCCCIDQDSLPASGRFRFAHISRHSRVGSSSGSGFS